MEISRQSRTPAGGHVGLQSETHESAPIWTDRGQMQLTVEGETDRAHPQDALGQGDIITIEYPEGQTGPALGLVINADCDLANGKTDGTIAYLPIFSFREYLAQFWVPGYLRSTAAESAQRIVEVTKAGNSGADDLIMLLKRLPRDEAVARLCGLNGVRPKDHQTISEHVQKLIISCDELLTPYARFECLCRLHKDPQRHARSLIENARKGMGEGHFFISDLVGQPDLGFVIRMRRIYSIAEDSVFASLSMQRARSGGDRVKWTHR